MLIRKLLIGLLCTSVCFGQGLPDRDDLVKKFLNEATELEATAELYKHFGMGGVRTIIRNVNELPLERRLGYGEVFFHMDLDRFINDLNGNLQTAEDVETRAMWLMLLSRVGRSLSPDAFEKYAYSETEDMRVRLAAMSGLCQVQAIDKYNKFYEIAEKAVVDLETGQNDLAYANLSKTNQGFYFYTKSRLDKDTATHGSIITALAFADHNDSEIFESIINLKQKKYITMVINRAVQVGGVEVLEQLDGMKVLKRYRDQINMGKATAAKLAEYRNKLYVNQNHDLKQNPLGAAIPMTISGSGRDGFSASYVIVKVAADGTAEVVENLKPFGGTDSASSLAGKTIPAFVGWEPQESYYLRFVP